MSRVSRRPSIELAKMMGIDDYMLLKDTSNIPKAPPEGLKAPKMAKGYFSNLVKKVEKENRFQERSKQEPKQQSMVTVSSNYSCESPKKNKEKPTVFNPAPDHMERSRVFELRQEHLMPYQFLRSTSLPINLQNKQAQRIHRQNTNRSSRYSGLNQSKNHNKFNSLPKKQQEIKPHKKRSSKLLKIVGMPLYDRQSIYAEHFPLKQSSFKQKTQTREETIQLSLVNNYRQNKRFNTQISRLSKDKENQEKQIISIAGKAKEQVKQFQFFCNPGQNQKILNIQLRQRIKSDMTSKKVQTKLEKAKERTSGCWSLKGVTKTRSSEKGPHILKLQSLASKVKEKKVNQQIRQFRSKVVTGPKNKLVL